jgi:hypothetical protein
MKHNLQSFRDAIAFVREKRPKICPNLGFERQLKEYESVIFKHHHGGSLQRKVPKTSEEQKHCVIKRKNIELPEIGALGRTHIRNIVLDPFSQKNPMSASKRGRHSETSKKEDE